RRRCWNLKFPADLFAVYGRTARTPERFSSVGTKPKINRCARMGGQRDRGDSHANVCLFIAPRGGCALRCTARGGAAASAAASAASCAVLLKERLGRDELHLSVNGSVRAGQAEQRPVFEPGAGRRDHRPWQSTRASAGFAAGTGRKSASATVIANALV